jgi:ADP-ribosylglycohydrolase
MQTTPRDLLRHELDQRRESGYDLGGAEAVAEELLADPARHDSDVLVAYRRLVETIRPSDRSRLEPDDLDEILASLPPAASEPPVQVEELQDRVHGAWLGRVVGCNLGKPIEWGDHWTPEHIRDYLSLAGSWPLSDYIPVLDPLPARFELHDSWPETTRGRVDGSARDDDIDFAMLALHLIETHGAALRPQHVADAWLERLPYLATYTAERATYRNLVNLLPVERAGRVDNPYREWIGAQIRADVFGYVNPGRPRRAAVEVYQDASLSHRGNGIYGAMWAAALVAAAFTARDAREALLTSVRHVPPRSRLGVALQQVLDDHERGLTWEQARGLITDRHGHYSWVHTVNNSCVVAAGLLWADGDFSRAIGLTVSGGLDTDSNGATAGSVAGILAGRKAIPPHWEEPLHDRIRSALAGFDGTRITELAERTLRVIDTREGRA